MRILILVTALLAALNCVAAPTSSEQIRQAADAFLNTFAANQSEKGFKVFHSIGQLDSRLSLAICDSTPEVTFSGEPWESTQPSLLVSCEGERPWRMFLPVTLEIRGQALVAARPLARGQRITEAMLKTEPVEMNATRRSPIRQKNQLIGMEMRRGVNAGTVFTADLLTAPDAITRGDHVVITAETGGFSVRSRGKALGSGGIGEQVLVENLSSARTVRARITAPGQVEIPM
ncbi:flagellar basal body P-ring formation chaperone FlgA [Marinobacter sp. CHS3-4]|uniref:flagellar basal body P-ring formation chaperone FlgA n=1 Tax=Marinobacter sp. CHS3-4 TaxID=3045174 RepID=UPI0024B4E99A|nr:flagellar basal body P-ring formation chaperone FlgA [Marinobacter sp. CHS3-4]MDI9245272.1 flagellar basal body P-ring formation chaperone FlgA [Marinobacter sp. CHS3-4]